MTETCQVTGAKNYYTNTDNGSNKFWSISVKGKDTVTCYGKVGTSGKVTSKNHFDGADAACYAQDKIREKLMKGYYRADDGEICGIPADAKISIPFSGGTGISVTVCNACFEGLTNILNVKVVELL